MKHLAPVAVAALLAAAPIAAFAQTPNNPAPAPQHPTMHRAAHHARRDSAGDPDTRALNLLEANGYTNIQQFKKSGASFEATVMKNGKTQTVTVDPGTGQITSGA